MTLDLPPILLGVGSLLRWLNILGIAVFAMTGALAAARREQTLVTFCFFALITATGGGTVRDLLIDAPVFWLRDNSVPLVCFGAAFLTWFTPTRLWSPRALDWFDAVGLASYAVFGTAKALTFGIDPIPAAVMGIVTACVGGIIRDVFAGEPSILMRPELYVTAAALASAAYVGLLALGLSSAPAAAIAAIAGFGLRALAITRGLSLPNYNNAIWQDQDSSE